MYAYTNPYTNMHKGRKGWKQIFDNMEPVKHQIQLRLKININSNKTICKYDYLKTISRLSERLNNLSKIIRSIF